VVCGDLHFAAFVHDGLRRRATGAGANGSSYCRHTCGARFGSNAVREFCIGAGSCKTEARTALRW
jgi:hypothetical protein